jgi:hypothetical protein
MGELNDILRARTSEDVVHKLGNMLIYCERCVVCRRAKIQRQMAVTIYPLLVRPKPWYTLGLDYLTCLPISNGFGTRKVESNS